MTMKSPARAIVALGVIACAALAAAQQVPQNLPDPLIRENITVKLAAHSYAIPDGNIVRVPGWSVFRQGQPVPLAER